MHQNLLSQSPALPLDEPTPGGYAGSARALAARVAQDHGTPALILDCDLVRSAFRALSHALPGVRLHYAVKALPEAAVLRSLNDSGASFDVASAGELEILRNLGIATSGCLHTHPVKRPSDITAGVAAGVSHFVFDCAEELEKLAVFAPGHRLLLRIGYGHSNAVVQLSNKFGCDPGDVDGLLAAAARRGLVVDGLCFHVGSQSLDGRGHADAIRRAAKVMARHPELQILDIGGGFPVTYDQKVPDIHEFCAPIRRALEAVSPEVQVLAEPGRFLVAPAVTAVASVMGTTVRGGKRWYFLDDGVYGSFSGRIFDHARYPLWSLNESSDCEPCVVAGPTCDGLDIIDDGACLPTLAPGDLVLAGMMGAYTLATASAFNSFPRPPLIAINEAPVRLIG